MLLLIFKLAVSPLLVAVVSLAARRFGPAVGGMLVGLPWMTGPVLVFLAIDKGHDFAAAACVGIELGVVCVALFLLAYAIVALFAAWPLCVLAGALAFGLSALVMREVPLGLIPAAAAAVASLALAYLLLPRPRGPSPAAALPWWDIPARMLSTLLLVASILLLAETLGAKLSGIVSTYPTMVTVVSAFTHHQWGRDAVLRLLRSLTLSLIVFAIFFLAVGLALPVLGLAWSFVLAAALALAIHGAALLAIGRS